MSCCRSPAALVRTRARTVAVCTSCQASLRELVAAAMQELSRGRPRGTHHATARVTCPKCRLANNVPVTWVRR